MTISKILVGVDHSDRSDRALRRANELALFHDAKLILHYALDVGSAQRLRSLLERVAVEETQERAESLLGEHAAALEVQVRGGRTHEGLRDAARELGASLIAIGVHRSEPGLFGPSGSTARRLINVAPAPVLVVTDEPAGAYGHVLVGFDGSPASRAALRFARELAPGAKITLVTACMIPFSARKQEAYLKAQFEEDARKMVRETLGEEVQELDLVVRVDEAYAAICAVLKERKPDLLVLGTSMSEAYRRVFGGGIVDLIAADPPCDLLVVKT